MKAVPLLNKLFSGRSKDRWNPVEKNVLFLNFKSELSAYDKFMHFGREPNLDRIRSKQDRIRHDSRLLKRVLDGGENIYYGHPILDEDRFLTAKELGIVSEILGRSYEEARFVRHKMFGGVNPKDGISIIFKKTKVKYSEAHAGSGEVAVVSAVLQILNQPKYSLILLDEPEVSMHPGAQQRFLLFLARQVKEKQHQVIFTTHSPELIRGLPDNAIKVLEERDSGKFGVISETSSSLAFSSIGVSIKQKLTIYVEDKVAKHLVEASLKQHFQKAECDVIKVEPWGSASTIRAQRIPTLMLQDNAVIVILDGDKKPSKEIPKASDVSPALLETTIKELFEAIPELGVDGNAGASDAIKKQQKLADYLEWCRNNLFFLPGLCPEAIILNAILRGSGRDIFDAEDSDLAKDALYSEIGIVKSEIESSEEPIFRIKQKLSENVNSCPELKQIADIIKPRLKSLNS